ncbi:MAG: homocysteine S-methyltransferase [Chloroflexi bacterium]|nr:homocysteine S-methyltransferase [Chloroflexota bacterium]
MRSPLRAILDRQPVVVLDGALATELEARGCDLHDPLWSARVLIEQPELIRQVHADYYAAGADVATTASYQATFEGFARRGFSESQAADLMRLSVALAIEARDAFWADPANRANRVRPLVAASVGPYGAFLADGSEYRGDYALDEDGLVAFHRARFGVLAGSGADLLACETIPCLSEARALLRLLDAHPGTWAWISFSCTDGAHLSSGESFSEAAALVGTHPQVAAVGVNCTAPRFILDLIRAARAATSIPVAVYPNSGEDYDPVTKTWQGERACDAFADDARSWFDAGARVIGGCCRTTPAHIRAVTDEIMRFQSR